MYRYLDNIECPADLKKLSLGELQFLADEIRHYIVKTISKTGGHLSSNLGTIELIIALHYVFDSPKDKLIFDVGHQAYTHKILTGRKKELKKIRKSDGISGYLKRSESEHDVFGAGHATTSLSSALGFSISNSDNHTIAVIGDGSLTGGMAYEALNILGSRKEKVIIIINDNAMSISENVGAMYNGMNSLRTFSSYYSFKDKLKKHLPNREKQSIGKIKNAIKHMALPTTVFESLGSKYYGPVDGHNIVKLVEYFERLKDIDKPVVLHTITKKGKGYKKAEISPTLYHGVSPFCSNGGIKSNSSTSFSTEFGNELTKIASKDDRVYAVTAAMPSGTGLSKFGIYFPERLIDVGIAEANAVTMSAAMALDGKKPFVAIYSTFLQRAFDQLIHDVALQNAPVRFVIDRSGLVGQDGETHQGIFDVPYLTLIPNMRILAPKDTYEMKRQLRFMNDYDNCPIALKIPRNNSYVLNEDNTDISKNELISNHSNTLLVSYSRQIKVLFDVVKEYTADIYNMRNLWPLDIEEIKELFQKYDRVFMYEECSYEGSISQKLKAYFPDIITRTLPTTFINHGTYEEQIAQYKLDKDSILEDLNAN